MSQESAHLSAINEKEEFPPENNNNQIFFPKIEHSNAESLPSSAKRSTHPKKTVSILEPPTVDEQVQILNEKIEEQELRLRDYEAKIAQLNEEKYNMNEKLRDMSICCGDLKKEKDVIFENFQKVFLTHKNPKLKENEGYDSIMNRNSEELTGHNSSFHSFAYKKKEKPIRLSKFLSPALPKNLFHSDNDNFSISSFSNLMFFFSILSIIFNFSKFSNFLKFLNFSKVFSIFHFLKKYFFFAKAVSEMSESDQEILDRDLLFPFNSRGAIFQFFDENKVPLGKIFHPDFSFFKETEDIECKPCFKKACLIGRLQMQIGSFGLKIKTQKLENGALKLLMTLRRTTEPMVQKFFLGMDSLSG